MWTKLNSLTSNLAILNSISHRGFQFGTWGPRSWNSETRSFGRVSSTFVPWPWCLCALMPRPETCSLAILSLPAIIFFFWRGEHRLIKLEIYSVWLVRKFIGDETNRRRKIRVGIGELTWRRERRWYLVCSICSRRSWNAEESAIAICNEREWVRLRDFKFWGIYMPTVWSMGRKSDSEAVITRSKAIGLNNTL